MVWQVALVLVCLTAMRGQTAGVSARRATAFTRSHTASAPTSVATRSVAARAAAHSVLPAPQDDSPAALLAQARLQHLALASANALNLSTPWSPVGPVQVQTAAYGLVTGRVSSIALDPSDTTNNTVYVGTSGGGVWKSRNAAGAQPTFTPLTDTLPVFSAGAGSTVVPSLSIGALAVQPGGTGVVVAGTGDPNDAADSYYGGGILRSADNGTTWTLITGANTGSFVGEGFAGIAWSTVSPNVAVAAVSTSAESAIVKGSSAGVRGLFYSTNNGAGWGLATIMDGATVLQNRSTSYTSFRGNAVTAVVWNPVRKKFYAAIRAHGYYESADGQTWTRMVNQPGAGLTTANCPARPGDYGLTSCPIFRGALAVQPTSGDMFALTVDAVNGNQGLWQDVCAKSGTACASATVTWGTQMDATPMEDGTGVLPQGDYNLTLAAVPAATALSTTDTLLFAGAGDLYRCSLAGGCTLRNTTNATTGCAAPAGVAPAQHAIAWGVNTSNTAAPTMYFGNDGGLWRSLDGVNQQAATCSADDATHFTNLNGSLGSLAEVGSLAAHPTDPNILLASLGAIGSAASTTSPQASAASPWVQLGTGESGAVAVDQTSGNTWLVQSGGGVSLHSCSNGAACTAADFAGPSSAGMAQVSGDGSLTDPPALLDPGLSSNLLVGTCRVWRGPLLGGGTWSGSNAISPFLAGPAGTACNDANAYLRSLAAGGPAITTSASQNSGASVLYAGLAGGADGGGSFAGHIYRTTSANTATATTAWADLTNSTVTNDSNHFNTAGFDVSSIAVDPSDGTGNTVYATILGFGVAHVYRSVNGGTTWTNISANLPNSPANSVVVDPKNPLTIYVAMDTGVYVATDVTTCVPTSGTGSCWSVLGTALPNAPVLSLVASAGVTLPGSTTPGALRAATYGRGVWQIDLVSSAQVLQPKATFTPASLTFAAQNLGSTSAAQTVTLTNTGNTLLQIGSISSTAPFSETDTCANTDLTVNASCTLTVLFTPTAVGTTTGTVQLNSNVGGGTSTLTLTGTGRGVPNVVLSPGTLTYADTPVHSIATAMTITVSNTGTGVATLNTPAVTADFNIAATTCTTTLAVGDTCIVAVTFQPSANGARAGTLTVADSVASHAATLFGVGTGTANVTYTPASLSFAGGEVATRSSLASVTISNSGTAYAVLSVPVVTGADYSVYTNTCGSYLQTASSCVVTLLFAPVAAGTRTGTLSFQDGGRTNTVSLTGIATAAPSITASPATLTFATTPVNGTSASQVVTVTNGGGGTYLSGVQVTGDFGITANTCGTLMNANQVCQITVVFGPMLDGPRSGAVTVKEQTGVAHTVLLSGAGHGTANVTIAPTALTFPATGVGSASSQQTITVSNTGTAAIALGTPTVTGDFNITATTCTASIDVGGTCTVSLHFLPRATGTRTGTLSLTDASSTHTATLTGTGTAGVLAVAPASLTFADTVVNAVSAARSVTLSNTGDGPLNLTSITVSSDFVIGSNTCGASLAVGASCAVGLTFNPTTSGARTGALTIVSDSAGHAGTATMVTLGGNGRVAFAIVLTPASLNFGSQITGTASAVANITISNTGVMTGALGSITVSGDFLLRANTCGRSLAAQTGCTVSVLFLPTANGARTGLLTVMDDAGTQTATLTGTGTAAATDTLSPLSLTFAQQQANTVSASQLVSLTNNGDIALTLVSAAVVAGDFSAVNGCGPTVPAHTTCGIAVSFTPRSVGALTGTLQITDVQRVQTVTLTGTAFAGPGVSLLPSSITFASTGVGVAGAGQTLTLTNNGGVPLLLAAVNVSGDFGIVAGTSTCRLNTAIPVGGSCSMSVAFLPTGTGDRTGKVTVTSNGPTQVAQLEGTGVDFMLQSAGTTSQTISSGGSAAYLLLLRPTVNTADPVTYACSGAPANAKCTVTPQYRDLSAVSTVTVTVLTGTTAHSIRAAALALPILLGLPWWLRRRTALRGSWLALLAIAMLVCLQGCGSSRVIPNPGDGSSPGTGTTIVTPTGTYNITVSATAAGVTHSVPLTLIVK